MKKIVVIGGGHGQSTILQGLRDIEDIELSAIVTVADDGGSTGRIRQHFAIPAMGDIRNVLLALSKEDSFLKQIMNYRFEGKDEVDVEGHSLGNLILTALTQMEGSFANAINVLIKELNVKGKIYPSSLELITLYAEMDDGTIVKGEANIPNYNHHIDHVFYDHEVSAYKPAIKAIEEADLIIYGIGSIYTSILPNIIIKEVKDALVRSKAKKVYFANCMTQNNETFDYTLKQHLSALEKHGAPIDMVVRHNETIPLDILKRYQEENSTEVKLGDNITQEIINAPLLDFRSGLVRHDPKKIKEVTKELLKRL